MICEVQSVFLTVPDNEKSVRVEAREAAGCRTSSHTHTLAHTLTHTHAQPLTQTHPRTHTLPSTPIVSD